MAHGRSVPRRDSLDSWHSLGMQHESAEQESTEVSTRQAKSLRHKQRSSAARLNSYSLSRKNPYNKAAKMPPKGHASQ